MAKLFGEFLLEKEIVTKTDLVNALVKQIKLIPSVTEIVLEHKLLPIENIYDVLLIQYQKKISFVEAAKELGCWSKVISDEVERRLSLVRMPLGEILIQNGAATIEVIVHAIDQFLSETKFDESQNTTTSSTSGSTNLVSEVVPLNLASVDFNNSSPSDSKNNLTNNDYAIFFEKFSMDSFLEIKVLLGFSQNIADSEKLAVKAMDFFHLIHGSARFCNLSILEKLFGHIEQIIQKEITSGWSQLNASKLSELESNFTKLLELAWQIREELEQGKQESEIVKANALENVITALLNQN